MHRTGIQSRASAFALLLVAASMAFASAGYAQERIEPLGPAAPDSLVIRPSAGELYEKALRLHAAGDHMGSYRATKAAAKGGHPQAQRRLAGIYDSENEVVYRNYARSIIWYQRARAQGEIIPTQAPRSYGPSASLR